MPEYIVETIVSYKMRYLVTADRAQYALDEVTCMTHDTDETKVRELDQHCLGEIILSVERNHCTILPIDPSHAANELDTLGPMV